MRVALGIILSAIVLIGGSAIGALDSWAIVAGGIALMFGALAAAVLLDEPELAATPTTPYANQR
jgi:hypothetical protein